MVWRLLLVWSTVAVCAVAEDLAGRAAALLQSRCGACHSPAVRMSGLDVSSLPSLVKGGGRGPAIAPGNPEASLLFRAVSRQAQFAMPPTAPLPPEEVALLRKWIEAGAPWPVESPQPALEAEPRWWSFLPPERPRVPSSKAARVRNPIDEFVLAKLHAEQLEPAPEADRATLARRLFFDLTGLPPTADDVDSFVNDPSPRAYEELVDRLLASPRYGEKWARHWLDLVRYSDTAGFEIDPFIADAWRYRDYVIQSFNDDKPYDRFIREQIAGDEFFPEEPESITGTGYFCVGPNRDMYPDQSDINREETLTDYVDTTGSVFLGLTIGCARCHDHKFDPFPQRDYYRLRAVFAPAVKYKVALNRLTSLGFERAENIREVKLREIGEEITDIQSRCRAQLSAAKLTGLPEDAREALRTPAEQRTERQRQLATEFAGRARVSDDETGACLNQTEAAQMRGIEKRLVAMFANYRPKPFACGLTDVGDHAPDTLLPVRGSKTGELVTAGFPAALGGGDIVDRKGPRETTGPIPLNPTTGRRRALADWIASPSNPLTARVMVNRIWQGHFGRGLVATSSDFGTRGLPPSHPELLDWLAVEFIEHGWSVKHMHRLILNSATYRQSSKVSAAVTGRDPENIYLSYFKRRRLGSEEIRDAILQASGELNLKMGGRPVVPPLSREELFNLIGRVEDNWIVTADTREHDRRSIYMFQKRTFRMPMMEVFDAPESMLTCSRRDSSTTAPQSLTLLNSGFTQARARALASRPSGATADRDALIRAAWRTTLSRDPLPREMNTAREFLARQTANTGDGGSALAELIRGLFNINEFLYVD